MNKKKQERNKQKHKAQNAIQTKKENNKYNQNNKQKHNATTQYKQNMK